MWISYNANPGGNRVGDCTVRAISEATGKSWEETYVALALRGYMLSDMPSANHVWGAYLKANGYRRYILPDEFPDDYTVSDFCRNYPEGTYILAINGHVVCVKNGDYIDTWDSGNEIPLYYWKKE